MSDDGWDDSNWTGIDDLRDMFNKQAKEEAEERARHPERDYSSSPYRDKTKRNSWDDGDPNDNFRP